MRFEVVSFTPERRKPMSYWNVHQMPGALENSLTFILEFLQELKHCKTMTPSEVVDWGLQRHVGVGGQFLIEACQFLAVLDLCSGSRKHSWRLKPLGHELLSLKQPLDQKRLLAKQLVLKINGVREILEICATTGGQLLTNQEIEQRLSQYHFDRTVRVPERTEGLRMCECLEMVGKGRLLITPLGIQINDQFPIDQALARATSLVYALKRAALDSEHHKILESVVRQCFEFLGFKVIPLGDRGDTDLVLHAPLGPRTYCAIVDPKTSHNGRVEKWNAPNIAQHKQNHKT